MCYGEVVSYVLAGGGGSPLEAGEPSARQRALASRVGDNVVHSNHAKLSHPLVGSGAVLGTSFFTF